MVEVGKSMEKLILVVEDESAIRELIIEIINEKNYCKCSGAGSGSRALELMKTITFDLITLDMNMPEMDGNGFLKELSIIGSAIPVIVITATPKSLQLHPLVKEVIAKPFDIEQIITVLDQHIGNLV